MQFQNTIDFALEMDQEDPLKHFRDQFYIPKQEGKPLVYFTGNSLGLQPKSVESYIKEELLAWENLGVEGHIKAKRPWLYYHKNFKGPLSQILGAKPEEVVSMSNLTANLHHLMGTFYRPTGDRYKIVMETGAFPSDQYVVETQVKSKGYSPEDAIVEVSPSSGNCLRLEDISKTLDDQKDSIALVFFSGVQYYTGQRFNIKAITQMAHSVGAYAGFDLAHAAGNVPLSLHEDNVDFASWCSYKYLNSGPGNVSGVFIHERHGHKPDLPRFGGWWGHDEETRFLMEKGFNPMPGADGWQLSNVNVLASAAHLASLKVFEEAGMESLWEKSMNLTGYFEYLIHAIGKDKVSIITPEDPEERGCQLSLVIKDHKGKEIFDILSSQGIVVDWREPDVIRAAPVPLYNSFEDVFTFCTHLRNALENV
jgi:kynureninase